MIIPANIDWETATLDEVIAAYAELDIEPGYARFVYRVMTGTTDVGPVD